MAIQEVFHVCASELPINANATVDIPQGCLVSLDSNGLVVLADRTTRRAIGLAADSLVANTAVTSYTLESGSALSRNPAGTLTGSLVVGSQGASQRFTQNRVSDNYNEVLASGKMTVYHSGGEFWTDQYEIVQSDGATVCNLAPATRLFASGPTETAATADVVQRDGRFSDEATGLAQVVGIVLTSPTAYPSGVPGTNVGWPSGLGGGEGANSLSWGNMLHVKLSI